MKIGLYSAVARQSISAARALLAAQGCEWTVDHIRRFRRQILRVGDDAAMKSISQYPDFFAMSSCRDLLFHVQEHHTTIPEIKAFLTANDLGFIGFDGPMSARYAEGYPADSAMTDLDCWHQFELKHPTTFLNMYQFWVQKRAF
jgi:hypothetical protein